MQCGSGHHAEQRMQFSRIESPKCSRGCTCNGKFEFGISQNVAMCMICNGVEQNLVAREGVRIPGPIRNQFLFDASVNHAHCDVFAYAKRKLLFASATPRPLCALDSRKLHSLPCVVLAARVHDHPAWVLQNVELSSLSLPTAEHIFHSKFTCDRGLQALFLGFVGRGGV